MRVGICMTVISKWERSECVGDICMNIESHLCKVGEQCVIAHVISKCLCHSHGRSLSLYDVCMYMWDLRACVTSVRHQSPSSEFKKESGPARPLYLLRPQAWSSIWACKCWQPCCYYMGIACLRIKTIEEESRGIFKIEKDKTTKSWG